MRSLRYGENLLGGHRSTGTILRLFVLYEIPVVAAGYLERTNRRSFASLKVTSRTKSTKRRFPSLPLFEALDEFEGVDRFRDQFEIEALALPFEEDI